ncbi:methylmalonic aciduria and homocystinuria type D homolog, mitochondrial [Halictus rubicundus]|uniref:methylmalonic aciduria and homocystinuria type D homolog, mitochondrial n=1 Tax=Halictus rubicundus TaxID=77578 RepID=UPI0040365E7D
MFCLKYVRSVRHPPLLNFLSRNHYSRRSDKNTTTYKVVKTDGENIDDMDGAVLGINSNWELLTPRGFRFYLPGQVGPGWSDVTTTAQVRTQLLDFTNNNNNCNDDSDLVSVNCTDERPTLRCTAQECPLLLRKGIEELFPGCLDAGSPQLTIITICQRIGKRASRWSREAETERLAKYFVLAAYDICSKLKMIGYWADFINPFSGQPHLSLQKNNTLYKTDERFRCLGFKIVHRNSCKVILHDNNDKNFIGSLYTTAPASTAFLKEILRDCELVNLHEA